MRTQEQSKLGEEIRDSRSEEVNPVKLDMANRLCALEQTWGSPVTLSSLSSDLFLPTCHFYLYVLNITAYNVWMLLFPFSSPSTSPSFSINLLAPSFLPAGLLVGRRMSKAVTQWSYCIMWPGSEKGDQPEDTCRNKSQH